jgi:hypothetical protein
LSALHYNLVRQCVPTSVPQAIFKDSARNGERKKEKFKYNEISREFLSGKWQYWSKLRALPNVFVSVFQSVFRIIFGVTLSVLVSYCNRADSAVATEKKLSTNIILRLVNFSYMGIRRDIKNYFLSSSKEESLDKLLFYGTDKFILAFSIPFQYT